MNNLFEILIDRPMKEVRVNGWPYFRRYFLQRQADGTDLWVHHFLNSDGDRHLHNHPFEAVSVPLLGGYTEEYGEEKHRKFVRAGFVKGPESWIQRLVEGGGKESFDYFRSFGRLITPFYWHRIVEIEPDTWTLMVVRPDRLPFWFFVDDEGNYRFREGSGPDWYKKFGTFANGNYGVTS